MAQAPSTPCSCPCPCPASATPTVVFSPPMPWSCLPSAVAGSWTRPAVPCVHATSTACRAGKSGRKARLADPKASQGADAWPTGDLPIFERWPPVRGGERRPGVMGGGSMDRNPADERLEQRTTGPGERASGHLDGGVDTRKLKASLSRPGWYRGTVSMWTVAWSNGCPG